MPICKNVQHMHVCCLWRAMDPLRLELQIVVSYYVGARNFCSEQPRLLTYEPSLQLQDINCLNVVPTDSDAHVETPISPDTVPLCLSECHVYYTPGGREETNQREWSLLPDSWVQSTSAIPLSSSHTKGGQYSMPGNLLGTQPSPQAVWRAPSPHTGRWGWAGPCTASSSRSQHSWRLCCSFCSICGPENIFVGYFSLGGK